MNYLKKLNISDETIKLLIKESTDAEVNDIENRGESFEESIAYLKGLGINHETIEKMLLRNYNTLLLGKDLLSKVISKINNVSGFVKELNENIDYMDYFDFI